MRGLRSIARRCWVLFTVVLIFVVVFITFKSSEDEFQVRLIRNGELPADVPLPVRFQRFDEPRLADLARREALPARIDPASSQFEQILSLKEWVAAQWPHGDPNPYPPWDALIILDWIRSGKTGGFCGQYSQVFLQSLAALGFSARYVEIGNESNPYAHYISEVWSNDFNKWVVMDVDFNLHFESNGIPLSALEIHDALLESRLSNVKIVLGAFREGHPAPTDWPLWTAELYYYLRYHLKADHLSESEDPSFDRFNDMIEWRDERVVPWEESAVVSQFTKERLTRLTTSNAAAVDFKINQVHIDARVDGSEVLLELKNNVLQFQQYHFRVGDRTGAAGPWRTHPSGTLRWNVAGADRWLEVRGVNVRGVTGPSSIVEIENQKADSYAYFLRWRFLYPSKPKLLRFGAWSAITTPQQGVRAGNPAATAPLPSRNTAPRVPGLVPVGCGAC